MAKAPEDRFGTCRELVTALQVALEESGHPPAISGPRAIPDPTPPPPPRHDPAPAVEAPAVRPLPTRRWRMRTRWTRLRLRWVRFPPRRRSGRPTGVAFRPGETWLCCWPWSRCWSPGPRARCCAAGTGRPPSPPTDQVPLSFSYPREWRQHVHPGQFAMLSPHDLTNFVSDLEDPWAAVRPLLANDRETVVGVFLPFRARTLDVDSKPNVEAALEGLLLEVPGKRTLSFLDHRPDKVDGHAADRVSGRMDDPGDQDTSLAFVDYVIQIKSGVAVHLLLFGPDERALGSADFNRLAKSVRLDAARVAGEVLGTAQPNWLPQ